MAVAVGAVVGVVAQQLVHSFFPSFLCLTQLLSLPITLALVMRVCASEGCGQECASASACACACEKEREGEREARFFVAMSAALRRLIMSSSSLPST